MNGKKLWQLPKIFEQPYRDPDDDLSIMSRQFIRQVERTQRLRDEIDDAAKKHGLILVVDYRGNYNLEKENG